MSEAIALLHGLDSRSARWLAKLGEDARSTLRELLKPFAGNGWRGRSFVITLAEDDDDYSYSSGFFPDGEHPLSNGVHIQRGYCHIARLLDDPDQAGATLAHELVTPRSHACRCHSG